MRYFKNCLGNFYRLDGHVMECWNSQEYWSIVSPHLRGYDVSGDVNQNFKSREIYLEIDKFQFDELLYMHELIS